MDPKKLIKDFPPSPIEDMTNWQGPPDKETMANINASRKMMYKIGKYNADKKLREDAIDSRMQKMAVNAGAYSAAKKDRTTRLKKIQDAEDARITKEWNDMVSHNTDVPKSAESSGKSEHKKSDTTLRGHGKAMAKRINSWKVK